MKRLIFIGIFTVLILLGISRTQAWTSIRQNALNEGVSSVTESPIKLLKLEKDIYGNETNLPVANAKFALYKITPTGDIQIGGIENTNNLGEIVVNLKPGKYYFQEIAPGFGFDFDQDSNDENITKYYFEVTENMDVSKPVVTVYNKRKSGSLEINKIVQNSDGSNLTPEQEQEEFEFRVTFSDGKGYYYRIDNGPENFINSGDTLKLRHKQTAFFEKIPQGVTYSVVEIPKKEYSTTSNNSSGTIYNDVSKVAYTNTFEKVLGQLDISKQVINGDGTQLTDEQKKQPFKFIIHFSDQGSYRYETNMNNKGTLSDGDTFELVHDEIISIFDIPKGVTYSVSEQPPQDYIGSPSDYSGTITSDQKVLLPFINQYKPSKDNGSMSFEKKIISDPIDMNQEFTFVVEFSDNGTYEYSINDGPLTVLTSGDKISIHHGDIVKFPNLPPGIKYTITEEPVDGYTPAIDKVSGNVLSNNNTHHVFENYHDKDSELVIEKEGEGNGFDLNKVFEFTVWINEIELPNKIYLRAGEISDPIPVKPGDTWRVEETNYSGDYYFQTSLINGAGTVSGPGITIKIKQINTYVGEENLVLEGQKTWEVPKDKESLIPKQIFVMLKDKDRIVSIQEVRGPDWKYKFNVPKYDADGKEIQYTVEEIPVNGFFPEYIKGTINIKNKYIEPITIKPPSIMKKIKGDVPEKDTTFEFRLNPGNHIVKITGEGLVQLDPKIFERPGSYIFTVTEINGKEPGYGYDNAIYTWEVKIVEKNGVLVVESQKLKKNGKDYSGDTFIFENEYSKKELEKEKITISGIKTWNYGKLDIGQRPKSIIVLLYANGKLVYEKEVTADEDWKYSFNVPKYDGEGNEIKYVVDEKNVNNFSKEVNGYDLKNTYIGKEKESPLDKPKTPNKEQSGKEIPKMKDLPGLNSIKQAAYILGGWTAMMVMIIIILRRKK